MSEVFKNFIEDKRVQNFILGVIIFNAVLLGLETVQSLSTSTHQLLVMLDKICIGIFVVELIIKMIAYRLLFVKSGWRLFDFVVVLISVIPATEYISVLRALRIIRVLRLISRVPSMRRVVDALMASIPGLASTACLLLLVYYVFAVMCVKLFGEAFPQWFGSIGGALYTLFQVMTLESWSMGIVRPVMEQYPHAWMLFVPFILVTSFILLNFLIGIIVDALAHMKHQEEEQHKEDNIQLLLKKVTAIEQHLKSQNTKLP